MLLAQMEPHNSDSISVTIGSTKRNTVLSIPDSTNASTQLPTTKSFASSPNSGVSPLTPIDVCRICKARGVRGIPKKLKCNACGCEGYWHASCLNSQRSLLEAQQRKLLCPFHVSFGCSCEKSRGRLQDCQVCWDRWCGSDSPTTSSNGATTPTLVNCAAPCTPLSSTNSTQSKDTFTSDSLMDLEGHRSQQSSAHSFGAADDDFSDDNPITMLVDRFDVSRVPNLEQVMDSTGTSFLQSSSTSMKDTNVSIVTAMAPMQEPSIGRLPTECEQGDGKFFDDVDSFEAAGDPMDLMPPFGSFDDIMNHSNEINRGKGGKAPKSGAGGYSKIKTESTVYVEKDGFCHRCSACTQVLCARNCSHKWCSSCLQSVALNMEAMLKTKGSYWHCFTCDQAGLDDQFLELDGPGASALLPSFVKREALQSLTNNNSCSQANLDSMKSERSGSGKRKSPMSATAEFKPIAKGVSSTTSESSDSTSNASISITIRLKRKASDSGTSSKPNSNDTEASMSSSKRTFEETGTPASCQYELVSVSQKPVEIATDVKDPIRPTAMIASQQAPQPPPIVSLVHVPAPGTNQPPRPFCDVSQNPLTVIKNPLDKKMGQPLNGTSPTGSTAAGVCYPGSAAAKSSGAVTITKAFRTPSISLPNSGPAITSAYHHGSQPKLNGLPDSIFGASANRTFPLTMSNTMPAMSLAPPPPHTASISQASAVRVPSPNAQNFNGVKVNRSPANAEEAEWSEWNETEALPPASGVGMETAIMQNASHNPSRMNQPWRSPLSLTALECVRSEESSKKRRELYRYAGLCLYLEPRPDEDEPDSYLNLADSFLVATKTETPLPEKNSQAQTAASTNLTSSIPSSANCGPTNAVATGTGDVSDVGDSGLNEDISISALFSPTSVPSPLPALSALTTRGYPRQDDAKKPFLLCVLTWQFRVLYIEVPVEMRAALVPQLRAGSVLWMKGRMDTVNGVAPHDARLPVCRDNEDQVFNTRDFEVHVQQEFESIPCASPAYANSLRILGPDSKLTRGFRTHLQAEVVKMQTEMPRRFLDPFGACSPDAEESDLSHSPEASPRRKYHKGLMQYPDVNGLAESNDPLSLHIQSVASISQPLSSSQSLFGMSSGMHSSLAFGSGSMLLDHISGSNSPILMDDGPLLEVDNAWKSSTIGRLDHTMMDAMLDHLPSEMEHDPLGLIHAEMLGLKDRALQANAQSHKFGMKGCNGLRVIKRSANDVWRVCESPACRKWRLGSKQVVGKFFCGYRPKPNRKTCAKVDDWLQQCVGLKDAIKLTENGITTIERLSSSSALNDTLRTLGFHYDVETQVMRKL